MWWTVDEVDALAVHKMSVSVTRRMARFAGIPLEKCPIALDRFGNTGSVSANMTLLAAYEDENREKGDKIITCGVGAGLDLILLF